jgi:hypothetical protein
MGLIEILKAEYVSIIAGAVGGVITAWLAHRVLNKRGTFSYHVNHSRVGMTRDDLISHLSQPVIRAGRSVQPPDPARVAPWPKTKSSFSPA